ncbi:MAG: hypothetical protein ACI3ZM_02130 [Candidatus Cryptobacteroides sp.]
MRQYFVIFMKALLLIWELPQNIIGAIYFVYLVIFSDTQICDDGDSIEIYSEKMSGGISLGIFRAYSAKYYANGSRYFKLMRMHEKGHRTQSKILGPLYLIVIGVPSLIWATLHSYCRKISEMDYFAFYTERWADKLGGVKR